MLKYLFLIFLSSIIYADTLGGEISLGVINHSLKGKSTYKTKHPVNLEKTLGLVDTQDIFLQASFEHPIPLIPNFKFGHGSFSYDGQKDVTGFSWESIQNFQGRLNSSLSLNYTDATLYYELLDNWIEIDAGMTLRYLSGEINMRITSKDVLLSYATSVPLLYAKGRFTLPSTDLSLQLETHAVSLGNTTSYDYSISARYTFTMGVGIEAGYKTFHVEGDALIGGLKTDFDFSGIYAATTWEF